MYSQDYINGQNNGLIIGLTMGLSVNVTVQEGGGQGAGVGFIVQNISFAEVGRALSGKSELFLESQGGTVSNISFMNPEKISGVIAGTLNLHSKF